mmetsp:Transcript_6840/g.8527  ORF Transcript_6840/g.8527 Transcript_6840/m.8527 type:complete len:213 (+) Transcript_6840:2565-3203(+)
MISGTSFGLVIAVIILSVMCSISLFPITSHAAFIASVAAALTCFFVSHIHAVTSGTISGRALPSCLDALALKAGMHFRASSRVCHFFSTGRLAKIAGKRLLIAKGVMFVQIARVVSVAAFFTSGFLLSAREIHDDKHSLLNGSADLAPSATAFTVASAARAASSSFPSIAPQRALTLAANPDLITPSVLMASTTEVSSPRDKFASLDSRDMI